RRSPPPPGEVDRLATRTEGGGDVLCDQPHARTRHARSARERRSGGAAAEPARGFHPSALPRLPGRRGLSPLRVPIDISSPPPPPPLELALPLLRARTAPLSQMPRLRRSEHSLSGHRYGEIAGGNRGEVSQPRRAAHGQRQHVAAGIASARFGRVPRGTDPHPD